MDSIGIPSSCYDFALTRYFPVKTLPLIFSHPSKVPCCQFFVGSIPKFCVAATVPAEPLIRNGGVPPCLKFFRILLLNSLNFLGSAMAISSML